MLEKSKISIFIILGVCILISIPSIVYGNAAEPPSIVIIVPNAPEGLDITIESNSEDLKKVHKVVEDKIIEKQYAFYSVRFKNPKIKVKTEDNSFEIRLDQSLKTYRNLFILDIDQQKLIFGKSLSRSILLISIRLLLTLFIEGIIFFIFGYREKKSWVAFLIVNLITQGALNIWLNGFNPFQSYLIIALIFGEFIVFIMEMILFGVALKEKGIWRRVLYVLVANFLSLIVGGYAITMLPI